MNSEPLELIVYYILPVAILSLGLIGNMAGLVVLKDKKLEKIGPLFMYRLMFSLDTVFLLVLFIKTFVLSTLYQTNHILISESFCKLFMYYGFAQKTYSPLILAYIALDRYLSTRFFTKLFFLKKMHLQ